MTAGAVSGSDDAPFHVEAEGATSRWVTAADGVRLRCVAWAAPGAWGTVLLFPGRSEYAEKFAPLATDLAARGLSTLTLDWRGQGLSDRLLADPMLGHVGRFAHYQSDVSALVGFGRYLGLPRPWFVLAHSMGGAIALRSLLEGLDVRAVAFSAPMWSLPLGLRDRLVAWAVTTVAPLLGLTGRLVPGQVRATYVLRCTFDENTLTSDRETFDSLHAQALSHPTLTIGGPTLGWLRGALRETQRLMRGPAPDMPALTILGTEEAVVDVPSVHRRMGTWPGGRVLILDGARHEVLMEAPALRRQALDAIAAHFATHAGASRDPAAAPALSSSAR